MAGGVDHGQAERAVLGRVMDALCEPIWPGQRRQPSPPFLVGAVQQHPGINRPAVQFIRRAHAQQHDRVVRYRLQKGADQLPVGGPGVAMAGDLPPGQRGRGRHESIPVQHHMVRHLR